MTHAKQPQADTASPGEVQMKLTVKDRFTWAETGKEAKTRERLNEVDVANSQVSTGWRVVRPGVDPDSFCSF